ncbi:MAG: Fic family protein [Deltaproteobacteria bacterium]|nr:Fic family protein [Deltaproteobacteria bacterium]
MGETMATVNEARPVGLAALIAKFALSLPSPAVTSIVGRGGRKTVTTDGHTTEKYSMAYMPSDDLVGHLRFALKHEPVDLGALAGVFAACSPRELEAWVRKEPNGAYARRAWFLYEWLTGATLDLPDARGVAYVDALPPDLHVVARGSPSKRHKVTDNLLGVRAFCPTVRRSARLVSFKGEALDEEARALVAGCTPDLLRRAVSYLYAKETKSSFEIEHETATGARAERFVAALRSVRSFEPSDPRSLVSLQSAIVDPRYAARGYREFQNFVGETIGGYREVVHFICPRPEDVASLMSGWADMAVRLRGATDPVVAAALTAFGFVFIHPFEDGNGRVHRFLIHHVLTNEGFTPPGVLFPVSAAIVRDRSGYDAALETFSRAIQPYIEWRWTPKREVEVVSDSANLYRYFDATPLAEFLYSKVEETIRRDLKEELGFVAVYDAAMQAVREIVDMPDRRASLFVQLVMRHAGTLSKAKRSLFKELSEREIAAMENAVRDAMQENVAVGDRERSTPPSSS